MFSSLIGKKRKSTYPDDPSTFLIPTLLNSAIHTLQVPLDEFKANPEIDVHSLDDSTRIEPCKISKIAWIEERVGIILSDEQA